MVQGLSVEQSSSGQGGSIPSTATKYAGMVKLADALGLGPSVLGDVGVQVPLPAPFLYSDVVQRQDARLWNSLSWFESMRRSQIRAAGEMADTTDLKSVVFGREGSTPSQPTNTRPWRNGRRDRLKPGCLRTSQFKSEWAHHLLEA